MLNRLDKTVTKIGAFSGRELASLPAGESPFGLALSRDESKLYVTDTAHDAVLVIDSRAGTVLSTFKTGDAPTVIKMDHAGTRLFVSNRGENTVSVINAASGREEARIHVGAMPTGMAVVPEGDKLYVSSALSENLSLINVSAGRVVETIDAGATPLDVVISAPSLKGAVAAPVLSPEAFVLQSFGPTAPLFQPLQSKLLAAVPESGEKRQLFASSPSLTEATA